MAAWAPWLQADIDCLEAVQKRAVKVISGLRASTYEERLRELGLPSLQDRRLEIDMVQTYKLENHMDTDNSELWFESADGRRVTRNSAVKHNLLPILVAASLRNLKDSATRFSTLFKIKKLHLGPV